MPVRLGRPFKLNGVSDVLDDPAYATGVGLLMWKMKGHDTQAPGSNEKGIRSFLMHMLRLFR